MGNKRRKIIKLLTKSGFCPNWNSGMLECWNDGSWDKAMTGSKKKESKETSLF
ncbi:hypothetical protein D1AOALGA4SA_2583 [Olavius algarvensis Delta 1 endosymbiont]|nr:hypothetical protein D1AOALGA4SA_2583 [Olavius algarvensis Delta 1 endosymbiont]